MTPMPVNPVVVVQIENGRVINTASNIGNDLTVVAVDNATAFNTEAAGKPFNSTLPIQPTQVLAMKKK